MDIENFLAIVPADQQAKSRRETLELWCHIYSYIEEKAYADLAGDDQFFEHVHRRKRVERPTVAGHLRKMAESELLQANQMRITNGQGQGMLLSALLGKPPTHQIIYTLPGQDPPLQTQRNRSWPKPSGIIERGVKTLADVAELRHWLSERHDNAEPITAEQNERLKTVVGDAIKLLRDTDGDVHRFYVSAAVRAGLEPEITPSESTKAAAKQP